MGLFQFLFAPLPLFINWLTLDDNGVTRRASLFVVGEGGGFTLVNTTSFPLRINGHLHASFLCLLAVIFYVILLYMSLILFHHGLFYHVDMQ